MGLILFIIIIVARWGLCIQIFTYTVNDLTMHITLTSAYLFIVAIYFWFQSDNTINFFK